MLILSTFYKGVTGSERPATRARQHSNSTVTAGCGAVTTPRSPGLKERLFSGKSNSSGRECRLHPVPPRIRGPGAGFRPVWPRGSSSGVLACGHLGRWASGRVGAAARRGRPRSQGQRCPACAPPPLTSAARGDAGCFPAPQPPRAPPRAPPRPHPHPAGPGPSPSKAPTPRLRRP